MAIHIEELTSKDYELISFIGKFDNVPLSEIKDKLGNKIDSIELRISQLSLATYNGRIPVRNSWYIEENYETNKDEHGVTKITYLGSYSITELGRKVLQDYNQSVKSERRMFYHRSVLIPIAVTIATNILLGVLQWLLPLILK